MKSSLHYESVPNLAETPGPEPQQDIDEQNVKNIENISKVKNELSVAPLRRISYFLVVFQLYDTS